MSFKNLGVEVVTLGQVQVGHDVLVCLVLEHIAIEADVMVVLIIFPILKVVYDCQLWWIVLQQDLNWY